jgi:hypothetical protein
MIRLATLMAVLAAQAGAGTLEGRLVTFTVETWDQREAPYVEARGRTVTVGQGVEFGLEPEGLSGGLDVVPVTVEIGPTRIELSYPDAGQGRFYRARFNGYVLRFETECALFENVAVDPASSMPVTEVWAETGALFINVSALEYGPGATLALDLEVADCPLS